MTLFSQISSIVSHILGQEVSPRLSPEGNEFVNVTTESKMFVAHVLGALYMEKADRDGGLIYM